MTKPKRFNRRPFKNLNGQEPQVGICPVCRTPLTLSGSKPLQRCCWNAWRGFPGVLRQPAPTLDEIAERAAAVRAGWSDNDRQRRTVTRADVWQPPAINLREVSTCD